jgi:hypothetical protein
MAEDMTREQTTSATDADLPTVNMDEPLPEANDPGGAHGKGYSADPNPEPPLQDNDPVPLAAGPDTHPAVRQPERERAVWPTERFGSQEKDQD